ncbi:amino acid permease [Thioclava dalianensis]|uniref:Amino acid permease n=1 Tax=Thioclava dalianensis TaxID=1185766 RepID=A0A074U8Y6_9RHOB|nr:APC family permease [Thioclava dalianensis]KEP71142.1 amino acid permease [Thioclava dalianensis]SFN24068.1 Amino acid transporter [Thioclava dalianensis]
MTDVTGEGRLKRNSIGTAHIIFFVVAAAAPMTAVVGATPPAFAFGNGAGVAGSFVLAGLLYLIFSVGYTAMTPYISGAGGFYSYVSRGLGSAAGIGGALMALMAYFAIQIAIYALFAVFMSGTMTSLGIDLPWWVWALAVLVVVVLLGRRNIVISGRVLGVCMIAELLILVLLDGAIVLHGGGPDGLTLAGFRPSEVFSPGLGVTVVFVLGAYVGFEATAIFAEEAHMPERTIPRATYLAVILITLFYAGSTWAITQYYGASAVQGAAEASLEGFYFDAAANLLGPWSVQAMNILLLTSLFACLLSFHNTLNRYFYTLASENLLWRAMSKVHVTHGSPHIAGVVQGTLVAIIIGTAAAAQADPYTVVFAWMSGLAVLAILGVQVLVSVSVITFFRKTEHRLSGLRVLVAPAFAAIGLIGAYILVSANISLLTGSHNPIVLSFPIIVAGFGLLGVVMALALKRSNPSLYDGLGRSFE